MLVLLRSWRVACGRCSYMRFGVRRAVLVQAMPQQFILCYLSMRMRMREYSIKLHKLRTSLLPCLMLLRIVAGRSPGLAPVLRGCEWRRVRRRGRWRRPWWLRCCHQGRAARHEGTFALMVVVVPNAPRLLVVWPCQHSTIPYSEPPTVDTRTLLILLRSSLPAVSSMSPHRTARAPSRGADSMRGVPRVSGWHVLERWLHPF